MKILFVASNLQALGGIQAYNRKLLAVLKELGEEVEILELPSTNFFQKIFFVFRFAAKTVFHRPDFIFLTNLNYSPLGFFANKFLNLPYSITFYGIEAHNIKKYFHRRAVKRAQYIIKVFEETGRNVIKQFPEVKNKIISIPNSVEGTRFIIKPKREDLIQKFGLKNAKIILTIGRMSILDGENKGYKRVIQAMLDVLKNIPETRYLLAGTGDDVPQVKKLIGELGLEDKVILTGAVSDEDMVDFYNLADIFVLPSKNEGFPAMVLLESLACGVPVVGGAQPGAKELFDEKYGLIVEPDNIQDIGKAIVKVLRREVPGNILDREWLRKTILEEYGLEAYRRAVKKALETIRQLS